MRLSPFEQRQIERLAQLSSGHVPTTDPIAIAGRNEGAAVRGKGGTVNLVVMTAQDGSLPSRRGVPKAHRCDVPADLGTGGGAGSGEQFTVLRKGEDSHRFAFQLVEEFA